MPHRKKLANAIRVLSFDAVQKANSGHPGMPMGMADIAEVLWNNFLRHNPINPQWINRDRFIVSNGHGSMLLYSLLHLSGYDLTIDDIKNFRQLHSKTPGHPEFADTPGVETTTGPLGQGLSNAVGMAIAERTLAAQFNRDHHPIIDHHTYTFVGDGCLMEGVSHEVCSLAGTLGLGKLIVFWDDNGISIDGPVDTWFTDNSAQRFAAYHWQVIPNVDGHDSAAIYDAIVRARAETEKPTLICCKTQIGFGSPSKVGSHKVHGAPLGDKEVVATRKALDWEYPAFSIPDEIYSGWDAREKGAAEEGAWNQQFSAYQNDHPDLASELIRRVAGKLPENWHDHVNEFIATTLTTSDKIATRQASQQCIKSFATILPEFLGGSADLTDSNLTSWPDCEALTKRVTHGNYIHYGVREFAMSGIMNGLALHGGFLPFGGTFLVFADYAKSAVRLAAMMRQRVIFVYSHDSIGLGEDGPTHQPIEHAAMLRLVPGLSVWRPADLTETAVAWQQAVEHVTNPTCLLLSRQALPALHHDNADNIARGGYVILDPTLDQTLDPTKTIEAIIIATGSEVHLAIAAATELNNNGKSVRVVSMPSTDAFDAQTAEYKNSVLPPQITNRVAVEAAAKDYWYKYVGLDGRIIGLDTFGASAPAADIYQDRGITVENIIQQILSIGEKNS